MDAKTESITEVSEYQQKLSEILDNYPRERYLDGLEDETNVNGALPNTAIIGLKQIHGITETMSGNLAAALIALNDPKVRNCVKGFYARHVELRHALYEWGMLQEGRSNEMGDY